MAVTQISRIQHRRGLEQDLPQLTSAELGWSLDTRRLYIGNGTLDEGAPLEGVTRILTELDVNDLTSNASFASYTFVGNAAGYTAQTGPSALAPVIRSYQQKFDDIVNVKDFGAVGDNSTDDTAAINRALEQIYKSTVSPTDPRARRTIVFPGGTYITSNVIKIPPYARLVGDGPSSTIIKQSQGNRNVANVCDSLFQTGASLGTGSAVLPRDIEIDGIQFLNSNTTVTEPVFVIDSASNLKIQNTKISSNAAPGSYPNLVSIQTTVAVSSKITFDNCQFVNGGNGISIVGTGVSSIRVINSALEDLSNIAYVLGDSLNFSSIGNYVMASDGLFSGNGNNRNFSLGDNEIVYPNGYRRGGLQVGSLLLDVGQQYTLTTSPTAFFLSSNTSGTVYYEIKNLPKYRYGTLQFITTNSNVSFQDDYCETIAVGANIFANSDSMIFSVDSGTATLKFSIQQFV
jgi:hypothetical protein